MFGFNRLSIRVQASINDPKAQTISAWPLHGQQPKAKNTSFYRQQGLSLRPKLGSIPHLAWLLIAMGLSQYFGDIRRLASLALMIGTLTFGMFLNRAGQPWHNAWEILLEPLVSAFRFWAWLKGQTSEPIPWK